MRERARVREIVGELYMWSILLDPLKMGEFDNKFYKPFVYGLTKSHFFKIYIIYLFVIFIRFRMNLSQY